MINRRSKPRHRQPRPGGFVLQFPATPEEIGLHYRVHVRVVREWLQSGQLTGLRIGVGEQKPRWRIRQSDIERFERLTASAPPVPAPRRQRVRTEERPEGFIKFFSEA